MLLEGHNEIYPDPSLLHAEQLQMPPPTFVGEAVQPPAILVPLLWACSFLRWRLQTWHSTAGGVSRGQSWGAESPPSPSCSHCSWCSPGCSSPSGLQVQAVGSCPAFHPGNSQVLLRRIVLKDFLSQSAVLADIAH